MKNLFKLTKFKRLVVLFITITSAILAIILGSTFYVSKNVVKSVEYGGGAEYLVKVETQNKENQSKLIANDVAQSIYERINPLGVSGATSEAEISDEQATVRITYPGTTTEDEKSNIERLIVDKPQLVLTDIYGNPLFNKNGDFRSKLQNDPGGWVTYEGQSIEEFYYYDLTNPKSKSFLNTLVPIKSGGAKVSLRHDGARQVQIVLKPGRENHWTNATNYISKLPKGKQRIVAWLDPHKFLARMNAFSPSFWSNAKGSLINLAHIDESLQNPLRENVIDAKSYLVSDAQVLQPLSGRTFVIEGNFTPSKAQNLARKINYGVSDYKLKMISSKLIDPKYGNSAFDKAVLAGAVVFAIITLLLVVNYGLLGLLSSVSIALFIFATLGLFTIMKGEYSPATIAALIIGIGMSVDAVIITFERLKNEMYAGASLKQSFQTANRKSFATIFDSNITTLIVACVLFYFGTRTIIGLSVTLILAIIFTLVVMLGFTRFISSMLVYSGVFQDKKWLVGLKKSVDVKVQKRIDKFNFIKNTKWFLLLSLLVLLTGIITFTVYATQNGSLIKGLHLSQEFSGGVSIYITPNDVEYQSFTSNVDLNNLGEQQKIHNLLVGVGVASEDISLSSKAISVRSTVEINNLLDLKDNIAQITSKVSSDNIILSNTTSDVAKAIAQDAFYAVLIAMGLVVLYTLVRFKWTYSIAAILALIHDALIVIVFFVIFQIKINPIFIAAVLSIIGYSINDTIVTFDRVREKSNLHVGIKGKEEINGIANLAIKETLKRSLGTSFTTIVAVLIIMMFGDATELSFSIAMLVGLVSGTYSSIFIATFIWTRLEIMREKIIARRQAKNFWQVEGIEEQTIAGINNF